MSCQPGGSDLKRDAQKLCGLKLPSGKYTRTSTVRLTTHLSQDGWKPLNSDTKKRSYLLL
ncbi:hypothetical protein PAHAL_9G018500 [Panicum hallii]|uniref:Uncharacterized protein n=1 Tax=Panicum hallii TaxID=206008 RepID=A0A2T8I018_9POAL|nr:hypothetical protein PAHAL_9G018500 [Panicum hallii]